MTKNNSAEKYSFHLHDSKTEKETKTNSLQSGPAVNSCYGNWLADPAKAEQAVQLAGLILKNESSIAISVELPIFDTIK